MALKKIINSPNKFPPGRTSGPENDQHIHHIIRSTTPEIKSTHLYIYIDIDIYIQKMNSILSNIISSHSYMSIHSVD